MPMIPEVKCRRCGEVFSSMRSRCPNCGTRRVTQSGRTPSPTPGTVQGTASYERAETNTKWQIIFGLILVAAVVLAVIVMVTTSLEGADVKQQGTAITPPVVTEYGALVGQVTELGENWATVSTLIDVDMSVGAYVGSSGSSGMVVGEYSFMRDKRAKLTYLADGVTPEATSLLAVLDCVESLIGDGAIKINQAIPGYIGRETLHDLTGIAPGDEL